MLPTEEIDRLSKELFRTRNRSVRRTAQRLHRIARRKGEKAKKELKEAYRKLVGITQASRAQAVRVVEALREHANDLVARRLLERFEHFVPLVEQGIAQATRRVLHDEQVPAAEKILSLFEEHTQIVTRQKMGKPREFGRKVLIDEVDGGIISRYEILGGGGSRASAPTRQLRGPPGALRRSAAAFGSRSRSLLGREREVGPRVGGKAHRATQEWASLTRAGAAREATLVQERLSLSGGDRRPH